MASIAPAPTSTVTNAEAPPTNAQSAAPGAVAAMTNETGINVKSLRITISSIPDDMANRPGLEEVEPRRSGDGRQ